MECAKWGSRPKARCAEKTAVNSSVRGRFCPRVYSQTESKRLLTGSCCGRGRDPLCSGCMGAPGPLQARCWAPGGRLFRPRPSAALRSPAVQAAHFLPSRFSDFSTWLLSHFITCLFCEVPQLTRKTPQFGPAGAMRRPGPTPSPVPFRFRVSAPCASPGLGRRGPGLWGAAVVLQTPR